MPVAAGGLNLCLGGLDKRESTYCPDSEGHAVHFSGELWHRIVPTFAAEAEGITVDKLITRMIGEQTNAPAKVI